MGSVRPVSSLPPLDTNAPLSGLFFFLSGLGFVFPKFSGFHLRRMLAGLGVPDPWRVTEG